MSFSYHAMYAILLRVALDVWPGQDKPRFDSIQNQLLPSSPVFHRHTSPFPITSKLEYLTFKPIDPPANSKYQDGRLLSNLSPLIILNTFDTQSSFSLPLFNSGNPILWLQCLHFLAASIPVHFRSTMLHLLGGRSNREAGRMQRTCIAVCEGQ